MYTTFQGEADLTIIGTLISTGIISGSGSGILTRTSIDVGNGGQDLVFTDGRGEEVLGENATIGIIDLVAGEACSGRVTELNSVSF
jgi:hypothetical protein